MIYTKKQKWQWAGHIVRYTDKRSERKKVKRASKEVDR